MVTERMLGRLDVERVARPTAVAVESSDPALAVATRDLGSLVRLDAPVVQPMGERHQVAGEPVAADVGALPGEVRERGGEPLHEGAPPLRATGISPSVGADDEEGMGVRGERGAIARIQLERVLDRVDGGEAEPGVARVGREAQDGAVVVLGDAVRLADQQDARSGPAFEDPELASEPVRQSSVEEPVASPRARVFDQEPMPDRRRGAREGLVGREAPQGAAIAERGRGHARSSASVADREQAFADQSTHQHRTAGRVGEGGRQITDVEFVLLVEVRDVAHRPFHPRRHLETPIAEEDHEAIGSRSDLADRPRTSRDRGGVVDGDRCPSVRDRPARELRPVGEEPLAALAGLRRTSTSPSAEASAASRPRSSPANPSRSSVHPAGTGSSISAVTRPTTPVSTSRQGVTWMPTVRWPDSTSCARAAWGVPAGM